MVAGETSGDLLAGLLLGGMKKRWPDLDSHGIGGPQMAQHGFLAWWPHHKLSVHGFSWELLRRYREIVGIRKQLRAKLLDQRPDVFVGVDAPDFNLDLEADLKAAGIKTVMLPARNRKDLEDVPVQAKAQLEFVFLDDVEQALQCALGANPT